jgi:hypothetical protein
MVRDHFGSEIGLLAFRVDDRAGVLDYAGNIAQDNGFG